MAYTERSFQSNFTRWLREKRDQGEFIFTFVYELKITKKKSLPFSRVEPHQISALLHAKHDCQHHKISDQSLGYKPYDGYQICLSPAYLVILFYVPRIKKNMYWIDIDNYVKLTETSKRKSITEEEADKISSYKFKL